MILVIGLKDEEEDEIKPERKITKTIFPKASAYLARVHAAKINSY